MIIADTGYWLALANRRDRHHQRAVEVTQGLVEPLITTWPVLTELCHLLMSRLSVSAQNQFMRNVESYTQLFELRKTHLPYCAELMDKFGANSVYR